MAKNFGLNVKLTLDTEKLQKGVNDATKNIKTAFDKVPDSVKTANAAFDKLITNAKDGEKNLGAMRRELRELSKINFDNLDATQIEQVKARMAALKDEMGDTAATIKQMSLDPFQKMASSIGTVSTIAQGVTGTMSLMGANTDAANKFMEKTVALMGIANAAQEASVFFKETALGLSIKQLAIQVKTNGAMAIFNAISKTNPLFLLVGAVAAIGAGIAYWYKNLSPSAVLTEKMRADFERMAAASKREIAELQYQIQLSQAKGKSELEILKIRKDLNSEEDKANETEIQKLEYLKKQGKLTDEQSKELEERTANRRKYQIAEQILAVEEVNAQKAANKKIKDDEAAALDERMRKHSERVDEIKRLAALEENLELAKTGKILALQDIVTKADEDAFKKQTEQAQVYVNNAVAAAKRWADAWKNKKEEVSNDDEELNSDPMVKALAEQERTRQRYANRAKDNEDKWKQLKIDREDAVSNAIIKKHQDRYEKLTRLAADYKASPELVFTDIWSSFGGAVSSIKGIEDAFKSLKEKQKEGTDSFYDYFNAVTSVISGIQSGISVFTTLANVIEALGIARSVAAAADTTATQTENSNAASKVAANTSVAATGAAASVASIPIVGWILAGAAVATMVALLAKFKFASGGIVPGVSFSGDKIPALVNSGEMILNSGQQSNLFKMLNGGGNYRQQSGGQVEFEIRGDKLYGVLQNYGKKQKSYR